MRRSQRPLFVSRRDDVGICLRSRRTRPDLRRARFLVATTSASACVVVERDLISDALGFSSRRRRHLPVRPRLPRCSGGALRWPRISRSCCRCSPTVAAVFGWSAEVAEDIEKLLSVFAHGCRGVGAGGPRRWLGPARRGRRGAGLFGTAGPAVRAAGSGLPGGAGGAPGCSARRGRRSAPLAGPPFRRRTCRPGGSLRWQLGHAR